MNYCFSVSQFISQINSLLVGEFIIEGEVSQYKVSHNKWIFFDLKDETSCLNCFSTIFMTLPPLEDGMRIKVVGYPKIHERSGRFSFTVQRVELVGEGTLQRAYALLKIKLTQEGLFDAQRKRSLPFIPESIGVIASRDSAAWGDFKRILNNRWSGMNIILRHTLVQGDGAVVDLVEAVKEFNQHSLPCDVLVLIRGGGSLEDLAPFNSEELVRAVYASKIPIICGIGHERDETLVDLVADVRASTPSNTAEMVVPHRRDFLEQLDFKLKRFEQQFRQFVIQKQYSIEKLFITMLNQFSIQMEEFKKLIESFGRSHSLLERRFIQKNEFINTAILLFRNVNPKNVLRRGFSITRTKTGKLIRSKKQVDTGDGIVIELGEGILIGEVSDKK